MLLVGGTLFYGLPAGAAARFRLPLCRAEVSRHLLGRICTGTRTRRGVVGGALGGYDHSPAAIRVRGFRRGLDVADHGVEQLRRVYRCVPSRRCAFPCGHVLSGCGVAQRPLDRYGGGDGRRLALCHVERIFRACMGRPYGWRVAPYAGGYRGKPHVGQSGAATRCAARARCGESRRAGREGRSAAMARRR